MTTVVPDGRAFLDTLAHSQRTTAEASPPRAIGAVQLAALQARGATQIAGLRQSGSLKLLFPRGHGPALEAVVLNTAGGLTGGDRMQVDVSAAAGARICLTTQAAERAYRAMYGARATVAVRLRVEAGARIDWLPQETIIYEGADLARSLAVHLQADARVLLVEPLIFGRAARGEVLHAAAMRDRWDIWQDDRLIFADALCLDGDIAARLARPAVAGGAGAMASVLLAAPDAERFVAGLRALLPDTAGVSLIRDGLLFVRLPAPDGFELRKRLIPVIEYLSAAPLPKVWRL